MQTLSISAIIMMPSAIVLHPIKIGNIWQLLNRIESYYIRMSKYKQQTELCILYLIKIYYLLLLSIILVQKLLLFSNVEFKKNISEKSWHGFQAILTLQICFRLKLPSFDILYKLSSSK